MSTDPNGKSHEHRHAALRPALAAEDPNTDFDYSAVEDSLGETADDRIADAINEAANGKASAKVNVAKIRAIIEREREDRMKPLVALCMSTLRCVLFDIQSAPKGTAARAAAFHRMAFDMRESNDESMRKAAQAWGVSPELVSKNVAAIQERHKLALGTFNKPAAMAGVYRDRNSTKRKAA